VGNELIRMQKQLKNLRHKHKKQKLLLKPKVLNKFKTIFKTKQVTFNTNFINIISGIQSKRKLRVTIKLTPNNVFCTLKNIKTSKTLLTRSSGSYKISVSKKKLKFSNKLILQLFIRELKPFIKDNLIILQLSGPLKLRKSIIKQFAISLKSKELIIKTKELKCFNGCRPKKKKRKKQKGLKVYK